MADGSCHHDKIALIREEMIEVYYIRESDGKFRENKETTLESTIIGAKCTQCNQKLPLASLEDTLP